MGLAGRDMAADSDGSGIGHKQHFGLADSGDSVSQGSAGLAELSKKSPPGRPTTSCEKAPYEQPARELGFVLSAG